MKPLIYKNSSIVVLALCIQACSSGGGSKGPEPVGEARPSAENPEKAPVNKQDAGKPAGDRKSNVRATPKVKVASNIILPSERVEFSSNKIYIEKDADWNFEREIDRPMIIRKGALVRILAGSSLKFKDQGSLQVGDGDCSDLNSSGGLEILGSSEKAVDIEAPADSLEMPVLVRFVCSSTPGRMTNVHFYRSKGDGKAAFVSPMRIDEGGHLSDLSDISFSDFENPGRIDFIGAIDHIGALKFSAAFADREVFHISPQNLSSMEGPVDETKPLIGLLSEPLPKSGQIHVRGLPVIYLSNFAIEAWTDHLQSGLTKIFFDDGATIAMSPGEIFSLGHQDILLGSAGEVPVEFRSRFPDRLWSGFEFNPPVKNNITVLKLRIANAQNGLRLRRSDLKKMITSDKTSIEMNEKVERPLSFSADPRTLKFQEFDRESFEALSLWASHIPTRRLVELAKSHGPDLVRMIYWSRLKDAVVRKDSGLTAEERAEIYRLALHQYSLENRQAYRTALSREYFSWIRSSSQGLDSAAAFEVMMRDISEGRSNANEASELEVAVLKAGGAQILKQLFLKAAEAAFAGRADLHEVIQYRDIPFSKAIMDRTIKIYLPALGEEAPASVVDALKDISRMVDAQLIDRRKKVDEIGPNDSLNQLLMALYFSRMATVQVARLAKGDENPYLSSTLKALVGVISAVKTVGAGSKEALDEHQRIMANIKNQGSGLRTYNWGYVENEKDGVSRARLTYGRGVSAFTVATMFKTIAAMVKVSPMDSKQNLRTATVEGHPEIQRARSAALRALMDLATPGTPFNPRGDFSIMIFAFDALGDAGPVLKPDPDRNWVEENLDAKKSGDSHSDYRLQLACSVGSCDVWNNEIAMVRNHASGAYYRCLSKDFHDDGGSSL